MVDLLECLAQIRALAETPRRLAALIEKVPAARWQQRPADDVWAPVEVLAHLADYELVYGVRLRAMLSLERPQLAAIDPAALARRAGYLAWLPGLALERFAARRAETLELLAGCSAAELDRTGVHPRRGVITVADHVAGMLAHDTSHAGQILERLTAHSSQPTAPDRPAEVPGREGDL